MVYCVQGEVFDVVLDLRVGSPTYGQVASFQLTAEKANLIYVREVWLTGSVPYRMSRR